MLSALLAAALLAGLAGAWSPCGFSMVDTLAPSGYAGRLRTTLVASAAFAAGALAGGAATFGGLALAGAALGLGGGAALALAAAALAAAAAGDAAGRRIVPQVRRQVPESWRRQLPVPLAAGLYGVLLGLGFTTFVLSFATWALALACLALGDPAAGLAVGLAFGAGRAVPVIALAPLQERESGARAAAAMAERPQILHGLRAGAALALATGAAVLALDGAPARAAGQLVSRDAGDPSAAGATLAWEAAGDRGLLRRDGGAVIALPGSDPSVAPDRVAWREGEQIVVARPDTLEPLLRVAAPGADELAVSGSHLAWRAHAPGQPDRIVVVDLAAPASAHAVAQSPAGTLGRPALDGTRLLYHLAGRVSGSRIVSQDLATGAQRVLRRARRALLLNPSAEGDRLVYVRSTMRRQQLIAGTISAGGGRAVYGIAPTGRRDSGHETGKSRHRAGYRGGRAPALPERPRRGVTLTLWTTAIAGGSAYVTRLRSPAGGGPAAASLLRVPLTAGR